MIEPNIYSNFFFLCSPQLRAKVKIEGEKRKKNESSESDSDSSENSLPTLTATTRLTLSERFGKMAQWKWSVDRSNLENMNMRITKDSTGGALKVMIEEGLQPSPPRRYSYSPAPVGHFPEELATTAPTGQQLWDDVRVRYEYYKSRGYLRDLDLKVGSVFHSKKTPKSLTQIAFLAISTVGLREMGGMVVSLSGMVETGTILRVLRTAANAPASPKEDSDIAKVKLNGFLRSSVLMFFPFFVFNFRVLSLLLVIIDLSSFGKCE